MTVTLDAFVTGDEAVVLMTGLPMGRVPTLIDRTSGARSVCQSTLVDGIPGMCLSFGYFVARAGARLLARHPPNGITHGLAPCRSRQMRRS